MVEVLIAGGGPAGATAALLLARAGARVLVVDRARFPRDKLCGDTLNPGALARLDGLGLAAKVAERGIRLDGMVVTGEGGVAVTGDYGPGISGRAVRRRELDAWLVAAAVDAGARFEERVLVQEPLLYHGASTEVRGVIVRGHDGRRLRLPAAVTIAADGRRSALAFGLGLATHPRWPRRWAAGGCFEQVDGLTSRGEMHVRRTRYLGVAPLPDDLANVCVVTADRTGFHDPAGVLQKAIHDDVRLRERFARARLVSEVISLGPLAVDTRAAGLPGLLLAGDAAGFIDPMTGDGMRFAIRGGELAARAALEMLTHGPSGGHERLAAWRQAEFGRKQRLNRALRSLVGRPAAVRVAAAASRVVPSVVRRLIAIAGDVDAA